MPKLDNVLVLGSTIAKHAEEFNKEKYEFKDRLRLLGVNTLPDKSKVCDASIIILVFSQNYRSSFKSLEKLLSKLNEVKAEAEILLVEFVEKKNGKKKDNPPAIEQAIKDFAVNNRITRRMICDFRDNADVKEIALEAEFLFISKPDKGLRL